MRLEYWHNMRRIVIASHHNLAVGMKDTLIFLSGEKEVYAINAYVHDRKLEEQIEEIFSTFSSDDIILIFTDMLGGSVNQTLFPYRNENVFVICGMNLPLVLACAMIQEDMISKEVIAGIIEEAKEQIIFMNTYDMIKNDIEDDE